MFAMYCSCSFLKWCSLKGCPTCLRNVLKTVDKQRNMCFLAALGALLAALGQLLVALGLLLAALRPLLAALEPLLARSWPLLGRSWPLWGRSWAALRPLLAALGRLLAALGLLLADLMLLLGRPWLLLGRSWSLLGRSWLLLAALEPLLGRSWPLLGCSWPLLKPQHAINLTQLWMESSLWKRCSWTKLFAMRLSLYILQGYALWKDLRNVHESSQKRRKSNDRSSYWPLLGGSWPLLRRSCLRPDSSDETGQTRQD